MKIRFILTGFIPLKYNAENIELVASSDMTVEEIKHNVRKSWSLDLDISKLKMKIIYQGRILADESKIGATLGEDESKTHVMHLVLHEFAGKDASFDNHADEETKEREDLGLTTGFAQNSICCCNIS